KTTIILLCWIALGANFAKGDHGNVCDSVYKAVDSGETNGNETPSPIDVNQCMS
uniref:Lysozyme n=1 Tax=Ciona savignyi TaxID=51511 RepID=H2YTC9_CIOSA